MRYEVLGSLRVADETEVRSISAPKKGTLLAALLVRADRVVLREELTQELWGNDPPRRSEAAVHVYISQVRKFLGRSNSPIHTTPTGYILRTGPDELDAHHFEQLVDEGRRHYRAGSYHAATTALDRAMGLWRGPALEGVRDGPLVGDFVTWLDELHLECADLLATSYLVTGRHHEVIPILRALVLEHPLHEKLHQQLMLALHNSGRRAEALRVYMALRTNLTTELGLEPSRILRELQQAILADQASDLLLASVV